MLHSPPSVSHLLSATNILYKTSKRDSQHQHASTVSPVCPFLYCIPSCMHITHSHPSVSVCLLSNCPYGISKLGNSLLNLEFCVWYPFVSSGDDKKLPSSSKVLGSVPCLLYIHTNPLCVLFAVYSVLYVHCLAS